MLSRFATPVVFCLFLGASPAAQVNYSTFASEVDLLDGGVLVDVEIDCMDWFEDAGMGIFVFFNEPTGDLAGYNANEPPGDRTAIIRSNAQLDADFAGDVTDCRSLTVSDGFIYAVLSVDEIDSVYKTDFGGSFGSVLGEADGTTGIDVFVDGLLYLARVESFGAPEDGFYSMSATEIGQTPVTVATHPDLDLYDLQVWNDNRVLSSSSKRGSGDFHNVIVELDPTSGSVGIFRDLFEDGVFTNGEDGGVKDIAGTYGCLCGDGHFVLNNSFSAARGEQFGFAGERTNWRVAEEGAMLDDPDVTIPGYVTPEGTHMVVANGLLYVASTSAQGGGDAIIKMANVPTPVELLTFDAVVDGATIRLTWATASETNNAGFEVQQLNGASWDVKAFVEGHGTTTVAQTYSFTTEVMDVGRHTFRLRQLDYDGSFSYSDELEVTVETPGTHLLSNAYPNPFNPQSQFSIAVARAERVSADLYNLLGQHIASLFEGSVEANTSKIIPIDGSTMASGTYIVRVVGETFSDALRVTLTK